PRVSFHSSEAALVVRMTRIDLPVGAPRQTPSGAALPLHRPAPSQASALVQMSPSSQALPLASKRQAAEQQSPATVFPSSHCSPAVTTPLPQPVSVQLLSQPSPLVWLPSSHASPASVTPLPQLISSAPMSTRPPPTRGAPSMSVSPIPAT